jgi:hypothetical protein
LRHPITPLRCGHGPTPTASPPRPAQPDGERPVGQARAECSEPHRDLLAPGFDGDLTDAGRRQAHELADRLAVGDGEPVAYVVCSPLRRARQTADIVGRRLGLPVAWSSTICGSSMRASSTAAATPGVGHLHPGARSMESGRDPGQVPAAAPAGAAAELARPHARLMRPPVRAISQAGPGRLRGPMICPAWPSPFRGHPPS